MAETTASALDVPYRDTPFHAGELAAQARAGFTEAADSAGRRSIRDYMPDQHRQFFSQLPFMIVGGVDEAGQPWATMRIGRPGFVSSPDSRTLRIAGATVPGDPLGNAWHPGALFAGLGIELPTRRRNRINGVVTSTENATLTVSVTQSFGNCAKYIQARTPEWRLSQVNEAVPMQRTRSSLSSEDRALLERVDTLFIASMHDSADAGAARGADVSHRGGMPGFVHVEDARTFAMPDYAGNRFMNTIGNLLTSPRAGLLIPDFETGDLLYVAADAEILWDGPVVGEFEGAQRAIRFHVRETRRSFGVMPFRWSAPQYARDFETQIDGAAKPIATKTDWMKLRIADIVDEAPGIKSFLLAAVDDARLPTYAPGQYLPIRVSTPGAANPVSRSYTLSDVCDGRHYRISVKRQGAVSSWLHEHMAPGDVLDAMPPRGAFTFDAASPRPAVFLSAGIGVTPMIAMLKAALLRDDDAAVPLYFIHSARSDEERPFGAFLAVAAAEHAHLSVHLKNTADAGAGGGRISVPWLKTVLPFDDYDFYLCGPQSFMRDIYDGLRALNVPDERIRFEAFGPSTITRTRREKPVAQEETEASVPVTFHRSGKQVNWRPSDGSLLELAETHGIAAPSSCRSGTCGTCASRILAGRVAYSVDPVADIEPGCALICIAEPERKNIEAAGGLVLDL